MTETRAPLVLLPGLLNDAALWAAQVRDLADIADPVVADLTRDESIAALAARVLAEAPPRFALAGLSMGGYVALAVALAAPERVERLALLDTNARADKPEQSARRHELIGWARDGRFGEVMPALLPMLVTPAHAEDEAIAGTVRGMATRVGPEGFIRQQTAIMGRPDRRAALAGIACPTLVLCGRDDALTPPEMHEEMRDGLPHARLEVIPDCGHLSPLEQPAAVSAAVRAWLRG
ncbi:alpha/beta fold hydrolase [Rhodospira trueperi]|uniref:Pimeloyl-ACP methyl ester carboxylesterase n=1 Tax=Rhodospira trueperi TaxID=69960 RepID=A0A1G6YVS9_9PROT|nr:alpha/beta fold hydrolase [Rhodospira trueperi]SDD94448.1 Pimeloyl-ACP methyl ester carboxylesterase [Rhodospira trueperi]